jgi:hypothetical protein
MLYAHYLTIGGTAIIGVNDMVKDSNGVARTTSNVENFGAWFQKW